MFDEEKESSLPPLSPEESVGLTLHGESIDLRPLLEGSTVAAVSTLSLENVDSSRVGQKSSLASSAPLWLKLLLPPLLLANHVLFYHGQTKPMWNLSYSLDVSVSAKAESLKSKAAFDALNLPHDSSFQRNETRVVETFTYMDAIRKLWKAEGLGDGRTSKLAAASLVLFSGVWPHAKLLAVHLCWFGTFPRRRFLRLLSAAGKWSLADVLVVCVLVAVLHLDWEVRPDEIRSGIEGELPALLDYVKDKYPDEAEDCSTLLNRDCNGSVVLRPACLACRTLIKEAFGHPGWAADEGKRILDGVALDGGGTARLRIAGMVGTYFLCVAVVASILLGWWVERIDQRGRREDEDGSDGSRDGTASPRPAIPSPASRLLRRTLRAVLSLSSPPLVVFAVSLPVARRLVHGGGPALLRRALGTTWERDYSILSLVRTAGDAGGWDALLAATLGAFVAAGPLLRASCLALDAILASTPAWVGDASGIRSGLRSAIDALGAFCAWEVLLVAMVMIQHEMPGITDTIYQDDRCSAADPERGRACVDVRFDATNDVWAVAAAWLVLIAASKVAMDLAEEEEGESTEGRHDRGRDLPPRRSDPWRRKESDGGRVAGEGEDLSALQRRDEREQGLEEIVFL